MKSKWKSILLIALCMIFAGCSEKSAATTQPEEQTMVTTVDVVESVEKSHALWLDLEDVDDFCISAKEIHMGEVVISPFLDKAMQDYPPDTIFAVAICFSPMVSDNELAKLSPNEQDDYLKKVFERASECCKEKGILADFPLGTCSMYKFFYAYGTEEQFRNLTCGSDAALYIAATFNYK